MFGTLDVDKNDRLEKHELNDTMTFLHSEYFVDEMFGLFDQDADGDLNLAEFVALMQHLEERKEQRDEDRLPEDEETPDSNTVPSPVDDKPDGESQDVATYLVTAAPGAAPNVTGSKSRWRQTIAEVSKAALSENLLLNLISLTVHLLM